MQGLVHFGIMTRLCWVFSEVWWRFQDCWSSGGDFLPDQCVSPLLSKTVKTWVWGAKSRTRRLRGHLQTPGPTGVNSQFINTELYQENGKCQSGEIFWVKGRIVVSMSVCTCMHGCAWMCMHVCIHAYMYTHIYLHMCAWIFTHVWEHTCVNMIMCVHACVCIHVYWGETRKSKWHIVGMYDI